MISRVQMKGPEGLRLGIPAGQVLGLRWEQNAFATRPICPVRQMVFLSSKQKLARRAVEPAIAQVSFFKLTCDRRSTPAATKLRADSGQIAELFFVNDICQIRCHRVHARETGRSSPGQRWCAGTLHLSPALIMGSTAPPVPVLPQHGLHKSFAFAVSC